MSPSYADEGLDGVPESSVEVDAAACVEAAPLNFRGMEILAPMVRAGTLPLRLECIRYGASLVYGEEIVDKKILGAARTRNEEFDIIDFVSPREKVSVFSTCAEERQKVFFQLGTANGALASQAAELVCNDVRGIDINMGCPKSFSVKGGMGAALLSTPEIASDILKSVRRTIPSSCALTCKIRLLGDGRTVDIQKTRDFMQLCERSGAEAITVHVRTRDERPAESAHWGEIVKLWDAVNVPVNCNGDFFTRRQIDEFWKFSSTNCKSTSSRTDVGPAGIMIARGALWNPSIFCRDGTVAPSFQEVVRSYTRSSVRANSTYQNCKWMLSQVLAGGTGVTPPTDWNGIPMKKFNLQLSATKSMAAICALVGECPYEAAKFPAQAHTTAYYRTHGPFAGTDAAKSSPAKENNVKACATTGMDASSAGRRERDAGEDCQLDDEKNAKRRKCDAEAAPADESKLDTVQEVEQGREAHV